MRRAVIGAVLLTAAGSPSGASAAAWTQPAGLGITGDLTPLLTFAPSGAGLVVWGGAGGQAADAFAARVAASGDVGGIRRITRGATVQSAVAVTGDQVALLASRGVGPRAPAGFAVGPLASPGPLRFRPLGRVWRPATSLVGSVVAAAADADPASGRVTFLYERCAAAACARRDLMVRTRSAGGRLSTAKRLDRGAEVDRWMVRTSGPSIVVAWTRGRGLFVRRRSPLGRWGAPQRFAIRHPRPHLDAIVTGGRTVVAWGEQRVTENGSATSPMRVRFAAAQGAGALSGARDLDLVPVVGDDGFVEAPGVRLLAAGRGRVLASWTGAQAGRFVVRARELWTRDAPVRTVNAAAPGALVAAAASPRGDIVLSWRGSGGVSGPELLVSLRPLGAAEFGPPEVVATTGVPDTGAAVAFHPRTFQPALAWRDPVDSRVLFTTRREGAP